MTISIKGFGQRIESKAISLGQMFVTYRGPHAWLALRAAVDPVHRFNLLLTQLRGEPIPHTTFPRFTGLNEGDHALIDGEILVRPRAFAIPSHQAPDGCLVVDDAGDAFIRTNHEGVDYYNLRTGLQQRTGQLRAYYTDWEVVQVLGPNDERVIAQMALTGGG